jgi:hypothetical protein
MYVTPVAWQFPQKKSLRRPISNITQKAPGACGCALHGVLGLAPGLLVLSTIYALSTAAGTTKWPTDVSHTRLTSASGGAVLLSSLAWMASTISCRTKGQSSSTGISVTHEPDYSKTGLGIHDGASWSVQRDHSLQATMQRMRRAQVQCTSRLFNQLACARCAAPGTTSPSPPDCNLKQPHLRGLELYCLHHDGPGSSVTSLTQLSRQRLVERLQFIWPNLIQKGNFRTLLPRRLRIHVLPEGLLTSASRSQGQDHAEGP